ncbi:DNA (cytosine-5)-methyltransferase [Heracleum sosnowskyi]|uniref:DNA (cytosine-5)-methyltransferase n=1 Tax=Heracleum sosnowskyi TaxID=360622 RepID=A0AAD8MFW6_9APIA|nr:DNA (cytosine-5)-methyltransferase [Heracleum sosnowskyi]
MVKSNSRLKKVRVVDRQEGHKGKGQSRLEDSRNRHSAQRAQSEITNSSNNRTTKGSGLNRKPRKHAIQVQEQTQFKDIPSRRSPRRAKRSKGVQKGLEEFFVQKPQKCVLRRRRNEERKDAKKNTRKKPTRAAARTDAKNKSVCLSEKTNLVGRSRVQTVEEESMAIDLTTGVNVPRPNRRLTNFIFHNADGEPQPVEMIEVKDIFISGLILPLEETSDKEKEAGIQCNGFGRIESWAISGYEDGSPVIWVSTETADYDCCKPANVYKRLFGQFYEKARACIEVHKRLSKSNGGRPDLTLDELVAAVLRSMSGSKNFPRGSSIKELVVSWGEFIYDQLTGLEGENFNELPVLSALREESQRKANIPPTENAPSAGVQSSTQLINAAHETLEKEDVKLARLVQEKENWKSLRQNRRQRTANSISKFYIRINEVEIANDYPVPAYYESTVQETDEYIICDGSINIHDPDELPQSMLHNWSLYNSDFRLISLELIPMRPCPDIDVTIFGSGIMTDDDGSGFGLDAEVSNNISSSSGLQTEDGIPVFLSAIKEWMIEFGSDMVFITIRTDMGWYRLGKPAKQYAPWYEPVLKTARLSISIIILLKDQSRVSRLTFQEVIKRVAEYGKDHPAYISNNPEDVERYTVVHGQIILQQFSEYPDANIRKCAFVNGLQKKMEERSHTRLLVKKRKIEDKERNLNPRGDMEPVVSKKSAMPATTTRLINRIWGEYYSNYLADDMDEDTQEMKKDEEIEEEAEENGEEDFEDEIKEKLEAGQHASISKPKKSHLINTETKWEGQIVGRTCAGKPLYKQVVVRGDVVAVSGSVLVETEDSAECQSIYFVEYMFEESDGSKWIHGRLMVRACQTVLGNTGNDREVFLTTSCMDFEVEEIAKPVVVEIRLVSWGHQHRKANANIEKNDRLRAEDRKIKGLPLEYFCKSFYCPERGAFLALPTESMGLGKGVCQSCTINNSEKEEKLFKLNTSMKSFRYQGTEFHTLDYLYVAPHHFKVDEREIELFKGGRNIGLKAYVVCQLLEIKACNASKQDNPECVNIKVRRFFRPDDISAENAYSSDIREVYYSDQIAVVPIVAVEGKCEVRRRQDISFVDGSYIFEHIFFCEHLYDPQSGALKQLPVHIKLTGSQEKVLNDATTQKKKEKLIEGKARIDSMGEQVADPKKFLDTLDIFAGCGGLSEGLQKSGASLTKWAIEYEEPAGEAFKLNHPDASTIISNCNVILRAIMTAYGDEDDCICTSDAAEMAAKLDETELKKLPRPGKVDFINGGPPCQGFSGMNRFNQSTWSKVQCEMILAFLSFVEYYRPRFFLLENVRNFVSFNKGQTFHLTLASLLAMGYQVRFGILEAGAYGVSQSRKRAFIWAASPEEILPEWPEPMHVFAGPELKIGLSKGVQYAAARSTATGAPFRAITVKDTIGDLPAVENGASATTMEYTNEPVSWFQKRIRGESLVLCDHISKEMNELNYMRCRRIPKRPGADWRDLPDEKVRLTNGQIVDLIPWCLPNTAKRHNQWKGLFGRLDWDGNFPTSVTDPQPMGKVGMCFHPDQDRILTVRECARSQGFRDDYMFAGNIHHKHRQIGNAVPPPLAFALGRKLKEAIENKSSTK